MRERNKPVRIQFRALRALLRQPGIKRDLLVVDGFAAFQAVSGGDFDEMGRVGRAREEDARFFEEFADRAGAVGEGVGMTGWVSGGGGENAVVGLEVAAREDMRGGEGRGGANAVG